MTAYMVKSTSNLTFSLTQNENVLGRLAYSRWFSVKASIELPEKTFRIEPKGFWVRTFEVKDNENTLLKFKRKWNGEILIHTYFDNENEFVFKRKGALKDSFILVDKAGTELLIIQPGLNWSKLNYEYQITSDHYGNTVNDITLLLVAIHCANSTLAAMAGVIASAA
jgi:uncharacterized protein YxjI